MIMMPLGTEVQGYGKRKQTTSRKRTTLRKLSQSGSGRKQRTTSKKCKTKQTGRGRAIRVGYAKTRKDNDIFS